jgi:regulator of replication initiation timing
MTNMPPIPPNPMKSRGNSSAGPSSILHDQVQQQQRPREVHPAVTEFQNRYAQVWEENDRLREENAKLRADNEVLRRVDAEKTAIISDLRRNFEESVRASDDRIGMAEAHFHDRLAAAERDRETYRRYACGIAERIKGCVEQLGAAHDAAMDMALQAAPDKKLAPTPPAPQTEMPAATVWEISGPKPLDEIERMIAAEVQKVNENEGHATPQEPQGPQR